MIGPLVYASIPPARKVLDVGKGRHFTWKGDRIAEATRLKSGENPENGVNTSSHNTDAKNESETHGYPESWHITSHLGIPFDRA